jgi:hypothetical protein
VHLLLVRIDGVSCLPAASYPFPHQCAVLVAHVLKGTARPFYGEFGLDRLVLKMKPFLTNNELSPIVEEALRLGVISAADWLA